MSVSFQLRETRLEYATRRFVKTDPFADQILGDIGIVPVSGIQCVLDKDPGFLVGEPVVSESQETSGIAVPEGLLESLEVSSHASLHRESTCT